jgi:hypothetical protein
MCRIAANTKEAIKLVEDGFTFVTGEYIDVGKTFKKPKYLFPKKLWIHLWSWGWELNSQVLCEISNS